MRELLTTVARMRLKSVVVFCQSVCIEALWANELVPTPLKQIGMVAIKLGSMLIP